jgi:hypothetical protein
VCVLHTILLLLLLLVLLCSLWLLLVLVLVLLLLLLPATRFVLSFTHTLPPHTCDQTHSSYHTPHIIHHIMRWTIS